MSSQATVCVTVTKFVGDGWHGRPRGSVPSSRWRTTPGPGQPSAAVASASFTALMMGTLSTAESRRDPSRLGVLGRSVVAIGPKPEAVLGGHGPQLAEPAPELPEQRGFAGGAERAPGHEGPVPGRNEGPAGAVRDQGAPKVDAVLDLLGDKACAVVNCHGASWQIKTGADLLAVYGSAGGRAE